MPQMSPMAWIQLYFYFTILLLIIMIMFYNIYILMIKLNNFNKINYNNLKKFINKW